MSSLFIDTHYFIAILQEKDQWHERAKEVENEIDRYSFVTTDSVLVEVLNIFQLMVKRLEAGWLLLFTKS